MANFSILFLLLAYRVFIYGGTAYLVFWRGQSAWWFVLAVLLGMISYSDKSKVD
jgi:hypothetical protein